MITRKRNQRIIQILAIILMIFSLTSPALAADVSTNQGENQNREEKVSQRLLEEFETKEEVTYLIKFKKQSNLEKVTEEAKEKAKLENLSSYERKIALRSAIVNDLKLTTNQSQKEVTNFLATEEKKGTVSKIHPYYIVNAMAVTTTKEVAQELAKFDQVEKILPNERRQLIQAEESEQALPTADMEEVEWNVEWVKAPEVWEQGIDGKGVVLATIDSGVQWDHPALKEKYRGYKKESGEVNHDFNWFDATENKATPYDDNGHGTHVTGTMVGAEADGSNQVGVAPGAKWIGVKAFTDKGGTDEDLLAAAEWILAPTDEEGNADVTKAPDIVNNSWGGGPGLNEWYREVVQTWRSAEIFPVFAAGNVDKDNPGGEGSIASPANYPESFAVGGTDVGHVLGSFSLRGPSPYDEIKPNIVAPGQTIRSSTPGDTYGTTNGTSMAAPAITGVAALMKSVNNELTVDEMENILERTALPLTDEEYPETPNNGYGHGLVDAQNAVKSVEVGVSGIEGKVTDTAGEPLDATLTLEGEGRSVSTDPEKGSYLLQYASGSYTLKVEAYGYHTLEEEIQLTKDEKLEMNFSLDKKEKYELQAKVVDAYTDLPIEGAIALLWEDGKVEPELTNQEGHFSLEAYEGPYTLKVAAEDYKPKEQEVVLGEDDDLTIKLKPFYGYEEDELAYDDGTSQGSSRFHEGGNAWAVRMSLEEGQDKAMVTGGKFYFYRSIDDEFQVEVVAANGPNGEPGDSIAGPFDAKVTEERDWTYVDLRDKGIMVEDDFYLVYHQTTDRADAPVIGHDQSSPFNGRSWEMYRGYWYPMEPSLISGNKMIRAIVEYEAQQPVITKPAEDIEIIEENYEIQGKAKPGTKINLENNGEEAETTTTDDQGNFAANLKLSEGDNVIQAISTEDDQIIGRSDQVTITVNKDKTGTNRIKGASRFGTAAAISEEGWTESDIVLLARNDDYADALAGVPLAYDLDAPILLTRTDRLPEETLEEIKRLGAENVIVLGGSLAIDDAVLERLEAEGLDVERIYGQSRTDTAVEIAKRLTPEGTDEAIVVSGWDFPDALSVASHAAKNGQPILLTHPDKLSEPTAEALEELGVKETIVIGGSLAIEDHVLEELPNPERVKGSNRVETNLAIQEYFGEDSEHLYVATGNDFADSLTGAVLAAKNDSSILLVRDELTDSTENYILENELKRLTLFGGKLAISEEIETELEKLLK